MWERQWLVGMWDKPSSLAQSLYLVAACRWKVSTSVHEGSGDCNFGHISLLMGVDPSSQNIAVSLWRVCDNPWGFTTLFHDVNRSCSIDLHGLVMYKFFLMLARNDTFFVIQSWETSNVFVSFKYCLVFARQYLKYHSCNNLSSCFKYMAVSIKKAVLLILLLGALFRLLHFELRYKEPLSISLKKKQSRVLIRARNCSKFYYFIRTQPSDGDSFKSTLSICSGWLMIKGIKFDQRFIYRVNSKSFTLQDSAKCLR
jgi:hypothetical protein